MSAAAIAVTTPTPVCIHSSLHLQSPPSGFPPLSSVSLRISLEILSLQLPLRSTAEQLTRPSPTDGCIFLRVWEASYPGGSFPKKIKIFE